MSDGFLKQLREGCVINYDYNMCDVNEGATDTLMSKAADEIERLRAARDALREFVEDLRMQAVHAESAEVTLANEYIIARIDAALKEHGEG